MLWIGLDLLPKADDRLIDRSRMRRRRIAPHFPQQLLAMDHHLSSLGQIAQQLELAVCQLDVVLTVPRLQACGSRS